ncbi:MAG: hypothetical protein FJ009_14010 [Chloroflexi bacterium]|nr:hypothetical protein [Chloroflexota bacterium]
MFHCSSFVVSDQRSAVSDQPSAISRQRSAVSNQPSAISRQQSAIANTDHRSLSTVTILPRSPIFRNPRSALIVDG